MDRVIYTDTPLKLTAYFRAQILCILCALEILIKDYKQCNRCMYCIKYVTLEVAVDKSRFRTLHSIVPEWLLSFDENWICKLVPVIESTAAIPEVRSDVTFKEQEDEFAQLNDMFWESYEKDKQIKRRMKKINKTITIRCSYRILL